VQCVQSRVRDFLGPTLAEEDDMGTLQLVRYEPTQKFDLHHDWYKEPLKLKDGRYFNRPISIFSFLEDNCTEGETYFPFISAQNVGDESKYRRHENGGVAFKPIRGNAIFWVNLFANGTGDARTRHAGLPVKDGTKVAMNVWPRKFYQ
jgi:prolyl 4-hydroxylase